MPRCSACGHRILECLPVVDWEMAEECTCGACQWEEISEKIRKRVNAFRFGGRRKSKDASP